ncbi:MAG TPA: type II toxin-antitoxin system RelE/ParE family toxin [Saprospiraceae bacterium]|nr:type II toxin-antitoxin system RelE/ParE family toxin [Lewinellaceae bacterium]HQU58446.1 type II toxin-antitoxin system RelE/ParE family toxin [Saprospiraceae bacterium]
MQVYLSQTAYDQVQDIILYLEDNWPEQVRDNFLDKLARTMEIMASMPYIFPASEKFPGMRKCVITPPNHRLLSGG